MSSSQATDRTGSLPAVKTTRCWEARGATASWAEEKAIDSEANAGGIPFPGTADVIISGVEAEATAASVGRIFVGETASTATEDATATRKIAGIIFDRSRCAVPASR
jgi:hypothetical protein